MDVDKRLRLISLGRQAKDVLENEAFQTCIDDLMATLTGKFLSTAAGDDIERERLWAIGQALSMVPSQLRAYESRGAVEQKNADLEKE